MKRALASGNIATLLKDLYCPHHGEKADFKYNRFYEENPNIQVYNCLDCGHEATKRSILWYDKARRRRENKNETNT